MVLTALVVMDPVVMVICTNKWVSVGGYCFKLTKALLMYSQYCEISALLGLLSKAFGFCKVVILLVLSVKLKC